MPRLSKTELMALDLAIQVMKDEQLGIQTDPQAFIGGIINVTKKVINVTKKVTPILKVVTVVTPVITPQIVGIGARGGSSIQAAEESVEPDISVEALIALRDALTREKD